MRRTHPGSVWTSSSDWLTMLGCTTLVGCSVTVKLPAQEPPAAGQPASPGPAHLVQHGYGSTAHFVRCLQAICPRPTPKTLARRLHAMEQALPRNRPAPVVEPDVSAWLTRAPQGAEATTLAAADQSLRRAAADHGTATKAQSGPPRRASQHAVTVLFTPASARIGPGGHARIVAAPVQGATRLIVRGHADPTGNAADNLRLAQKRAEAVATQLRASHPTLRRVRIEVVAGPSCCDSAVDSNAASHARQRSVEIVIQRQEPDP